MHKFVSVALAAVLAAAGTPSNAAWYKASSTHFVIYANESPKELSEFSSRLERFDQAVRYVRGMDDPMIGEGNRLTVFVLPSEGAVHQLAKDNFVDGFYAGRASGSVAFVPRYTDSQERAIGYNPDLIFFHEYSHHLMFQVIDKPLPEWVIEGFAEFMSTARFERNGDIGIGIPAYHRAVGLYQGQRLPLETMLSGNYSKISDEQRESIYGRGWLLIHYLTFTKARTGQLDRYAALLGKGTPSLEAARATFGDLQKLDRELQTYLNGSSMTYLKLGGAKFQAGKISVEPLTEGAAKVIMLRIQSRRGVDSKTAEPLAAQVRAIQSRYPGDELVELTLAEAELDAGHAEASEAAADRALKSNARDTKATIFKGRALAARAEKMPSATRHAAFEQARDLFIAANKIDTEDPESLMEFYKTFVAEGVRPNANAIAALHYASDLAPQDEGLRMNSAVVYLNEGKPAEGKRALTPIAYDPHGNEFAKLARSMIEKIDAGNVKAALALPLQQVAGAPASH